MPPRPDRGAARRGAPRSGTRCFAVISMTSTGGWSRCASLKEMTEHAFGCRAHDISACPGFQRHLTRPDGGGFEQPACR